MLTSLFTVFLQINFRMETTYWQYFPNENYIFRTNFRMETTYFLPTSEWKLHIVRMETTYLR